MKNPLPLIFALFSLFSISFCLDASVATIKCENKCMPEHNLTVEHTMEASGDWELIDKIELRKTDNTLLCRKDTSINISGGHSERVTSCKAEIPEMGAGAWSFKSCYIVDSPEESNSEQCFSESVPVEEWDCEANNECDADEQCYFNDCKPLGCGYCEYALNHACAPYECCSDSGCGSGEKCFAHNCINVECTQDSQCGAMEVCRDYECDDVGCKNSSVCEDDQECSLAIYDCVELDCDVGKVAFNHACVQPECTSDANCPETALCANYSCATINCPGGAVRSRICVPFDCHNDSNCSGNEACRGGFCQALECTGGRIAAFHQCSECDSDSGCLENEYCPSGTCVSVSCPGGEVFSHICIPPGPGSGTNVQNGSGGLPETNVPQEKPFCPGFALLVLFAGAGFAFAHK